MRWASTPRSCRSSVAQRPVIDVQGDGEGRVGIIRVAEAAGEPAVEIVLGVQPPAGLPVYLRQIFLDPQNLRQGVVGVDAVAAEPVEILLRNHAGNFVHLLFGAGIGMNDVGMEHGSGFVHGDAARSWCRPGPRRRCAGG